MTAPEIFKEMLKDPLLVEKTKLAKEKLEIASLHEPSNNEMLELVKLVIQAVENNLPERSVNSQIKSHFKL